MPGNSNGVGGVQLPLELHWDANTPLPCRWVLPEYRKPRNLPQPGFRPPFDFSTAMRRLCEDIVSRCGVFAHIEMSRVLISFTPSRNRSRYGLQARVTPLRFSSGSLTRRHGGTEYQVQRFFVDGREILYILTFCLPRFLDQPFEDKLVTVFHELYHVNPEFDGDLRRHTGRYAIHSRSKRDYDRSMAALVREYLAGHPRPEVFSFLRLGYRELWEKQGGIHGIVVPRPKLLPIGRVSPRAAARRSPAVHDQVPA